MAVDRDRLRRWRALRRHGQIARSIETFGFNVPILVDFLSPEDARAAGISRGDLVFDKVVQTGNGLLTGKITGNFAKIGADRRLRRRKTLVTATA